MPWVYALYQALASFALGPIVTMKFADFWAMARLKRERNSIANLRDLIVPVPPAYSTRLRWLTSGYISRKISSTCSKLAAEAGVLPYVILTNPAIVQWTKDIPDESLIYWNFDDYRLYQPERAAEIEVWESELIRRARIVSVRISHATTATSGMASDACVQDSSLPKCSQA